MVDKPNVTTSPPELKELLEAVAKMSNGDQLKEPIRHLSDTLTRKRQILISVQEILSQLRLDLKYLLFDLEATRRERDKYKKQLET